jgi:hypothetical protein
MVFYCLVMRLGVLDGWAGFYYAGQRSLAELMLSLYLFESESPKSKVENPKSQMQTASLLETDTFELFHAFGVRRPDADLLVFLLVAPITA